MHSPISVCIQNLGKYVEGELVFKWVDLPCDNLKDVFTEIGISPNTGYEEYHIPDWECEIPNLPYFEYADINELNNIAKQWVELDESQQSIISTRMNLLGESFDEALNRSDDGVIWDNCHNMADVARAYVNSIGLFNNHHSDLADYFNYEALGHDLAVEGCFDTSTTGEIVEVW